MRIGYEELRGGYVMKDANWVKNKIDEMEQKRTAFMALASNNPQFSLVQGECEAVNVEYKSIIILLLQILEDKEVEKTIFERWNSPLYDGVVVEMVKK